MVARFLLSTAKWAVWVSTEGRERDVNEGQLQQRKGTSSRQVHRAGGC
jgi:hypothetical protein